MGLGGEINLDILRLREKTNVYLHLNYSLNLVLDISHKGDEEAHPSKPQSVGCVHILNSFLSMS